MKNGQIRVPNVRLTYLLNYFTDQTRAPRAPTAAAFSVKRLKIWLLPPVRDASPRKGYPQRCVPGAHLYTWVERDSVEFLAEGKHINGPRPRGGDHYTTVCLYITHLKSKIAEKIRCEPLRSSKRASFLSWYSLS